MHTHQLKPKSSTLIKVLALIFGMVCVTAVSTQAKAGHDTTEALIVGSLVGLAIGLTVDQDHHSNRILVQKPYNSYNHSFYDRRNRDYHYPRRHHYQHRRHHHNHHASQHNRTNRHYRDDYVRRYRLPSHHSHKETQITIRERVPVYRH